MNRKSLGLPQQGQALLIIILIVVVVLTVVLSLATRSITNTRTTTEEDNSQRAFSAAEAGVEQLLKSGQDSLPADSPLGNNSSYSASAATGTQPSIILNNGNPVTKDDGSDFWLSQYPGYVQNAQSSGTYNVYWGLPAESCPNTIAAIEIVVIYNTKLDPKTAHYAFDPCSPRNGSNGFTAPASGSFPVDSKTFKYRATFQPTQGLIARIIPLYTSATIGVDSSTGNVPLQGRLIESIGTSSEAKRKISVFQGYPRLPIELFPYAIFSP